MIQIFNVGNKSVNRYLLISGSHRLLVDSGFPDSLHDLGRELRKTGYKIRDIDYLMVTHFHIDHAGAIQELKNEGVKFVLFDIQQNHIAPMEQMAAGKWPYTPLSANDNIILHLPESRAFLKQLHIHGQVIATPGHSEDSVSLLLDTGAVFTGDLPAPYLIADATAGMVSWQMIKTLGGKRAYPGHGAEYAL